MSCFAGRTLVVATMHGKERVIAPLLEERLGVRCVVPAGFDTDRYGTFTRDVARAGDQLEAAREKVRVYQTQVDALVGARDLAGAGADLGEHEVYLHNAKALAAAFPRTFGPIDL